jgi:hypothetical protein
MIAGCVALLLALTAWRIGSAITLELATVVRTVTPMWNVLSC